jgi:hypothetical protein
VTLLGTASQQLSLLEANVSKDQSRQRVKTLTKTALVSVSYLAFAAVTANDLRAQELPQAQQAVPSDESPSPPGTPAQQAPATQPDASPTPPATPAQQQPNTTPLPQVTVDAPRPRPHTTSTVRTSQLGATSSAPPNATPPSTQDPSAAIQAAWPASGTQDARTGTVGVYANSTSVATKINTPLVNIRSAS